MISTPTRRASRTASLVLPALGLALALIAGAVTADTAIPEDDRWHFQLVPYLWLPSVTGSLDLEIGGLHGGQGQNLGDVSLNAETDPDNYLSDLRAALMLIGEARKGRWSIYTDLIYTRFNGEDATTKGVSGPLGKLSGEIAREAEIDIRATIWTLGGGYRVVNGAAWNLDLIAGFRYLDLSTDLTLNLANQDGQFTRTQQVAVDKDAWDGIVGVRGQVLIPDTRWFLPYYLDIGTGDSDLTWQALVGAGYRFEWGEVTFALRSISYAFDENDADLRFTGPALGVGFRW